MDDIELYLSGNRCHHVTAGYLLACIPIPTAIEARTARIDLCAGGSNPLTPTIDFNKLQLFGDAKIVSADGLVAARLSENNKQISHSASCS